MLRAFFLKNKQHFLAWALLTVLLILFIPAFRTSGHIIFGDLDFGFVLEGYINKDNALWNDYLSIPNFYNLARFPVVAPLYYFSLLFGLGASVFEKLLLYALLTLSGLSMYFLTRKILAETMTKTIEKTDSKRFIWIASFLTSVFYVFNPWVITRVQHIYLLVGYAFIPLVMLFLIRLYQFEFQHNIDINFGCTWFYQVIKKFPKLAPYVDILQNYYRQILITATIAILWTIATGAVHYLFYIFFLVCAWSFVQFVKLYFHKEYRKLYACIALFISIGIFLVLFLGYWLFTYLISSTVAPIVPNNYNVIETVDLFSRFSTLSNVLLFKSYWWPNWNVYDLPLASTMSGYAILLIALLGVFLYRKNTYVRFFTVWTLIFIILSMGTKGPFADLFIWLVFGNPVAEKFGFIFRDPNKLVGLNVFGTCILFAFGLLGVRKLYNVYLEQYAQNYFSLRKKIVACLAPVAVLFIILIFNAKFISVFYFDFYRSKNIPKAYQEVLQWQEQSNFDPLTTKTLWAPRYESIVSPNFEYASTHWNYGQQTGAVDLLSSRHGSFYRLDAASRWIGYSYDYLFNYLLKQNRTDKFSDFLSMWGAKHFYFHYDLSHEEDTYREVIKNLLDQFEHLKLNEIFDFIFVFENTQPVSYIHSSKQAVYLTDGIDKLPFLQSIGDTHRDTAFFFHQEPETVQLSSIQAGDYLQMNNPDDIILSQVKKQNAVYPTHFTDYGDPSLKWARVRTDVNDWSWHLKKINTINWDMDFSEGVIFSFAPASLTLENYKDHSKKGKILFEMTEDEEMENLFHSTRPGKFQVKTSYVSQDDRNIPFIKGKISRGDSKLWKVANGPTFAVQEKTPYNLEFLMSGKAVNKLHLKVYFLDENGEELGITYLATPGKITDYKKLKLFAEFITPCATTHFRIELLTLENSLSEGLWWIHQMKLKDLSSYVTDNIIELHHEPPEKGRYKVFLRTFLSPEGGSLEIDMRQGEQRFLDKIISTKINTLSKFRWMYLGDHELDTEDIIIQLNNKSGFNAVNLIAFIPENEFRELLDQYNEVVSKSIPVYLLDAESDFNVEHPEIIRMANTVSPEWINGEGMTLQNGKLYKDIRIEKDDDYRFRFHTRVGPSFDTKNIMSFSLRDAKTDRIAYSSLLRRNNDQKDAQWIESAPVKLKKGLYRFEILMRSKRSALLSTNNISLSPFPNDDAKKIIASDDIFDDDTCFPQAELPPHPLFLRRGSNDLACNITKGYSCDWTTLRTEYMPVQENEQYFVSFKYNLEACNSFHYKTAFFDKNYRLIKTQFPSHIEKIIGTSNGNIMETFSPPENSAFISIVFLARQNPEQNSSYALENFGVYNLDDLPFLDAAIITGSGVTSDKNAEMMILLNTVDFGYRNVQIKNADSPFNLVMHESYSPFWQARVKGDGEWIPSMPGYGINNVFLIDRTGDFEVEIIFLPQRYFEWMRWITVVALLGVIAEIFYRKKKGM